MRERQFRELQIIVDEFIEKKDRIIPIIGDDAFEGVVTKSNETFRYPLQRWLAEMLLGEDSTIETKARIQKEGYQGLDLMFKEYSQVSGNDKFFEYNREIKYIIKDGLKEKTLFLRKDIKDFLIAGKFDVIATTCPYHILESELNTIERNYKVSSFSPISIKSTLTRSSKSEDVLNPPSIYQIFGDCDGEFVAGEEDLLKFLHYLNQANTEKGFGASQLVKYIKDKGHDNKGLGLLMPIGCNNLPNWIFRFLWYPFSYECLIGNDKSNQGGFWCTHSTDMHFYKFLKDYQFRTFSGPTDILKQDETDCDPVLKRLTEELRNRVDKIHQYISTELNIQHSDDDEWDIFISYASEDGDFARKIYDVLTMHCGKKVWMDNRGRIKPGDKYWEAIQHGIEHSHRFLFVISESYLQKAIGKNVQDEAGQVHPTGVYQEIERIVHHLLDKKMDGQKGSAIPLIIDGTKVVYTDMKGELHEETLNCGVLEKLPKYKEYELMQTEKLFYHIQGLICTEETLEKDLTNAFKQ